MNTSTAPLDSSRNRLAVLMALALAAAIIATAVPDIWTAITSGGQLGWDYDLYISATRRWLTGGHFYEPYQLSGEYSIAHGDILYPPVALWLFVPFTVLPAVMWWIVPVGIAAAVIVHLRPVPLAWPLLAICLAWPPTLVKVATGNPLIWMVAALALGVVFAGPAVFVLVKTSLAPFAFWGVRHRAWWLWLFTLIALGVPFGHMWVDWFRAVANSRGGGVLYSWQEIPTLMLPVVAWLGRKRVPVRVVPPVPGAERE